MKPIVTILPALLAARCNAASGPDPDLSAGRPPHAAYLFSNPSSAEASTAGFRIPTSYESAVLGRRILALAKLGTIATVFPPDSQRTPLDERDPTTAENRPAGLAGMPHGLPEYVANCEDGEQHAGDPTLLAITIATSFRNAAAGSNVSLAVQWTPPHPPAKRIERAARRNRRTRSGLLAQVPLLGDLLGYFGAAPLVEDDDDDEQSSDTGADGYESMPYSAANLPRFSLLGHLEPIGGADAAGTALAACFVAVHPDARYWLPGSRVHESHFVRLVVEQVYWIGGFGDRAFIGWIPIDEWRNVTRTEWEAVRLPGEKKGWKEWALYEEGEL